MSTVRLVESGDLKFVASLVASMGAHDGAPGREGWSAQLGRVIATPDVRGLVAVDDADVVVGYAEVHARPGVDTGANVGWLGLIAVAPDRRGQGIGALLLAAVDDHARALGCDHVLVESGTDRADAHRFYESAGFEPVRPARRFLRPVTRSAAWPIDGFLEHAARAVTAVRGAVGHDLVHGPNTPGADGSVTTSFDRAAECAALSELVGLGLPIVSEETGIVGGPVDEDAHWICLDPLDGTRNRMAGGGPYATAIGLVRHGRPVAGLVCDLSTGTRWVGHGSTATRDGIVIRASERSGLVAVPSVRGGESPPRTAAVRVRMSGSTAIDLCRVADGSLAAFDGRDRLVVHAHDLAGPWAVLAAAGAEVRTSKGPPLLVGDPTVTYPVVVGTRVAVQSLLAATGTRASS